MAPVKDWAEEDLKKLKANTFKFNASAKLELENEPSSTEAAEGRPTEKMQLMALFTSLN